MKTFFKKNLYLFLTILFIILFFKENILFKNCILKGCYTFIENVFPSLFPMFIIGDILLNYNLLDFLKCSLFPIFKKIFHMSYQAFYIFITSTFSGTPTNAYITASLVKEQKLEAKDASIILTYSCFLNPLFSYNMLYIIFNNSLIPFKIMISTYLVNLFIAFLMRNYKYKEIPLNKNKEYPSFTKALSTSIERSSKIFINILGTIIFYFIICEGINIFIKNEVINCFINGLLEATGGLTKLSLLNINYNLKEIIAIIFINFGGLSIHSQIKNILSDVSISYKPFVISRILSSLIIASIYIIIS